MTDIVDATVGVGKNVVHEHNAVDYEPYTGTWWCSCGRAFRKENCPEGIIHELEELSYVDGSCPCEREAMAAALESKQLAEEIEEVKEIPSNGNGHHHTPRTERRRGDPCLRRSNRPKCQGNNGHGRR